MRVGRELRRGLRKHAACLARRDVVRDDPLDIGFPHQFGTGRRDLVNEEIGAGAVFDDVRIVSSVTRDYCRASSIFDAVAGLITSPWSTAKAMTFSPFCS
jgi:hypothetical protein